MYAGRDSATGLLYTKLKNAGAVEEEFQFFACSYLTGSSIGYFVTGKEKKFFDFVLQCEQQDIYCTSGMKKSYWGKISGGMKQTIKRRYQLEVLNTIRHLYSDSYFDTIVQLKQIAVQNTAAAMLQYWWKQIEDCYDENLINLFEATLSMAMYMKVLTIEHGQKLLQHTKRIKKQLEHEYILQDGEKHIYAGFGYMDLDGQNREYKIYSKYYTAWQERQIFLEQGKMVSPILTKELYFDAIDFTVIQEKKYVFENLLQQTIDDKYFELLLQIYKLPRDELQKNYQRLYIQNKDSFNQQELKDFLLYGKKMGLFVSDNI